MTRMMFEDSKRYSGRLELKLNAATKRMPKWVSVKERLPEDRSNVLVVAYWYERWGVYMGWCAPERAEWSVHVGIGDRSDVAVVYWMPLPAPPKVHIRWAEDYWSGRYPECPSCGNMPYSLERCVFCGQRFLPDALTEEWSKPPEEVRMDCPSCGGKSTMVGARARSNGHFHGQCTVCGCVVME